MFRENVLVRDDIIARISETMVPVALDYQLVLDFRTRESRFLRPLMTGKSGDTQGAWIFTPAGKPLGSFSGFGDMAGKTKRMIERALADFGSLEPRRVPPGTADPERGHGIRADGSVRLAEYVRRRDRDKIRTPVISTVSLSAGEFAAFAPRGDNAAAGTAWTVPDHVAKKLCRAASPMCYQHAPQPGWVKEIALQGNVQSIKGGFARLRYHGMISSERRWQNGRLLSEQALKLVGEGVYDLSTGKLTSLLLVGSGTFRWPEESPDEIVPFDALIEWEAEARRAGQR